MNKLLNLYAYFFVDNNNILQGICQEEINIYRVYSECRT